MDHQALAAAIIGGGTGLLASALTALGLRDRIDKIERSLVGTETFRATCTGITERISAVQIDLNHQMEAMRNAAIAAENAASAARMAAERAVELARQYVEWREKEAQEWRTHMDQRIDALIQEGVQSRKRRATH